MPGALAITYGCKWPDCGYKTLPSTMGTPYTACPLCGGPWVENPPAQLKITGRYILDIHNGHATRKIVVRPHLRSLYDRIQKEKST